jgi:hypothetical protein
MKKSFLLMTLLCVSSMIFAQLQTQVATLKHDSNITVFYGQDAFGNDVIRGYSATHLPTVPGRFVI